LILQGFFMFRDDDSNLLALNKAAQKAILEQLQKIERTIQELTTTTQPILAAAAHPDATEVYTTEQIEKYKKEQSALLTKLENLKQQEALENTNRAISTDNYIKTNLHEELTYFRDRNYSYLEYLKKEITEALNTLSLPALTELSEENQSGEQFVVSITKNKQKITIDLATLSTHTFALKKYKLLVQKIHLMISIIRCINEESSTQTMLLRFDQLLTQDVRAIINTPLSITEGEGRLYLEDIDKIYKNIKNKIPYLVIPKTATLLAKRVEDMLHEASNTFEKHLIGKLTKLLCAMPEDVLQRLPQGNPGAKHVIAVGQFHIDGSKLSAHTKEFPNNEYLIHKLARVIELADISLLSAKSINDRVTLISDKKARAEILTHKKALQNFFGNNKNTESGIFLKTIDDIVAYANKVNPLFDNATPEAAPTRNDLTDIDSPILYSRRRLMGANDF
jgi:hypothetical protein